MYICDFSRSVGAGRATTRNTRGLTRSVIRLIVPPFPAVSRPSNTMQILAPVAFTHSCMATSSPCRSRISRSYSLVFIFGGGPASACGAWVSAWCRSCLSLFFVAMSLTSDGCGDVSAGRAHFIRRCGEGAREARVCPCRDRHIWRPGAPHPAGVIRGDRAHCRVSPTRARRTLWRGFPAGGPEHCDSHLLPGVDVASMGVAPFWGWPSARPDLTVTVGRGEG